MDHIVKKFYTFILILCFASTTSATESFDKWLNSLSDKEKIAKVFVTGVRGKQLSESEKRLLKSWPVGGVIYFKRNFRSKKQFTKLHESIKTSVGTDLFSFTDQEGGDVVRVGSPYDTPSPLAIGTLNSKKVTKYLGQAYGSLLKDLNISSNLAPVVDIKSDKNLDFISNRSYGSNSNMVTNMSFEFSKGLLESGVIPTLKHFPGIGGIQTDSHKKTASKTAKLKELLQSDWKPYQVHAKAKIPFFVMTSHTNFTLDNKNLGVVTYSKEAIDHLRKITSPSQVAITDDLEMQGAKLKKSFQESALESFMAGHDLILIGWAGSKLSKTLNFFYENRKNPLFKNRLNESLKRIYGMKEKTKYLSKNSHPFSQAKSLKLTSVLNSKMSEYFLIKNYKPNKRQPAEKKPIHFFSSDPVFRRAFNPQEASSLLRSSDKKIFDFCMSKICVLHLTGQQTANKIKSLLSRTHHNFIVINSSDPSYLVGRDIAKDKLFNTYTRSYNLGKQVKALLTQKKASSRKPQLFDKVAVLKKFKSL